jgi:hypothetical protein
MVSESMSKRARIPQAKLLGELQDLVGRALSEYLNDRNPHRADRVIPALERAFEICLILRSKYKR